jgi:hypothetical protein
MPKKFFKHKILFDENMQIPKYFPILNQKFDVKHIAEDYKKIGISDSEVYNFANKHGRIVVTYNIKDFKEFVNKNTDIGISGTLYE